MSIADTLDRFQQRHRWAGMPLAVLYKFFDDQGSYLAALITYYAFVSLFPLLLLLVTILGYALHGDPALQERVLNSALSQFPVIGKQLGTNLDPLRGNMFALIVGIGGSIYGGLGVAQAGQNAMNKIWAVPRNSRPNPFKARGISILLLLVVGGGVLTTTLLSGITTSAGDFAGDLGVGVRVLSTVLAVGLNSLLFMLAFRLLTARDIPAREVRTGALSAAVVWQGLQELGTYYVTHELNGASATYGVFGIVLGLIAWIYLGAISVVLCAEFTVVRANGLWPRSLLTPFTDDVTLTEGDRRAYTSYPETERHKGFEKVNVSFERPDLKATEPNRTEPNRAEPSRTEPSRAESSEPTPERPT